MAASLPITHVAVTVSDLARSVPWSRALVDASCGTGLAFRDPDGIAVELFAPPSAPPAG